MRRVEQQSKKLRRNCKLPSDKKTVGWEVRAVQRTDLSEALQSEHRYLMGMQRYDRGSECFVFVWCIALVLLKETVAVCLWYPGYCHLSPVALSGGRLLLHWKELNATSCKKFWECKRDRGSAESLQVLGSLGEPGDELLVENRPAAKSGVTEHQEFSQTPEKLVWRLCSFKGGTLGTVFYLAKCCKWLLHCMCCIWVTIPISHQHGKWVCQR